MRRSSFSRSPPSEVRSPSEPFKKESTSTVISLVELGQKSKNSKTGVKENKNISVNYPELTSNRDSIEFKDEIKQETQKKNNITELNFDFEEIDDIFASDTEQSISKVNKSLGNPSYNKRLECDDEDGYYVSYIGEIIGNRYKVSSNSTGKGMFSSVVKCVDMETQNEVAIKIIRINDMMRSTGEKEYSFFKKFKGAPNIVQVQGTFIHQNHLCIVFEWLHGSLKNCIHHFSKHNIRKTQDLAFQMFQGLKLIHDKGLVHADLKPENILIDSARTTIRISDFGSMHYASDASPACYLVSRFYRAPEIILGCISYGQSIDVWSIGCVLYECFTGDIMFKGRTNNDMIKLIMEYRGNFPKRLLNQGVFTKSHFSECFTQFKWTNPQGMLQIIKNYTACKNIYNNLMDSVKSSSRNVL
ncbi:kinase domain-containing [Cryptosporidium sp. chipmunk genotype I]|uniref:kinase domain-containing n=1 Tax=Cryptosporidium sp. chipmunk genotype I TaxID=1280935 RepID=UPI00351A53E6|nr:kinase domain-containing [Cryptosporidium sp. chipmunk genotype I]